jgi:putative sterol carrier protein
MQRNTVDGVFTEALPKRRRKMALTNVKEIFAKMPEVFSPSAAQGLDAVFHFEISGDDVWNWSVIIKDGTCQVQEGTHESPSVTLTMSGETWLGMVNKEINGIQAFMNGQLKASGDIMLAQRIEQLFPL